MNNTQVTRTTQAGPQIVDAPGSPGHSATAHMQSVPSDVDPLEYHEFLQWKKFKEALDAQDASENS